MDDDIFEDFDFDTFWQDSDDARQKYMGGPVTREVVAIVERELGYKLPQSYIDFMGYQNGGLAKRSLFVISAPPGYVEVNGMFSIGGSNSHSLLGDVGSKHWMNEWGYPQIGIYFADTPSAGHQMFCLDYSECGPQGEPRVVHVDQEGGYALEVVAPSFEAFVRGLADEVAE